MVGGAHGSSARCSVTRVPVGFVLLSLTPRRAGRCLLRLEALQTVVRVVWVGARAQFDFLFLVPLHL